MRAQSAYLWDFLRGLLISTGDFPVSPSHPPSLFRITTSKRIEMSFDAPLKDKGYCHYRSHRNVADKVKMHLNPRFKEFKHKGAGGQCLDTCINFFLAPPMNAIGEVYIDLATWLLKRVNGVEESDFQLSSLLFCIKRFVQEVASCDHCCADCVNASPNATVVKISLFIARMRTEVFSLFCVDEHSTTMRYFGPAHVGSRYEQLKSFEAKFVKMSSANTNTTDDVALKKMPFREWTKALGVDFGPLLDQDPETEGEPEKLDIPQASRRASHSNINDEDGLGIIAEPANSTLSVSTPAANGPGFGDVGGHDSFDDFPFSPPGRSPRRADQEEQKKEESGEKTLEPPKPDESHLKMGILRNPLGIFQDFLANCFYQYGLIICRSPRLFTLGPLILTIIFSFGILNMRIEDDLRFLYSPEHSLSRVEYQVHKDFSGDSKNNSFVSITIQTKSEDKNLLKKELAQKLIQLNKYVLEKMDIQVDGKVINFGKEVCSRMKQCELSNTIATIFLDTFWSEKLRKDPRIKIEYPTMKFFDNKFFLPTHFYGVKTGGPLGIQYIDMVHFVYQIPAYNEHTSEEMSKIFEQSLTAVLENQSTFDTSMFSLSILKDEMQKNATYTMPFISLTILLLLCFTVASCMTDNWVTSKPIEAMIGILVSSMAIVSAGGLLFALGVPFINQVTVMPFIALAIGVDDVYVMLGAWQDTKKTYSPEKRMALALAEAGSAITVTSITSVLSFGIGTYSTTPAIAIFCKFICVAIMFDWFYQLTFFAAVMAMGAKREAAGYHCVFVWKRCDRQEIEKGKSEKAISPTRYFFENIFAPFICRPSVRIFMLVTYVIYIGVSFYGCAQLIPNLTPSRLVVDDSPLIPYLHLAEKKIWAEGLIGRIYVNNAPDFSKNPELADRMLQMVNELESTPYSMGPNSTNFWLSEFNNYRQFFFQDDSKFYETLKSFLQVSFNSHWETDLVWNTPDKNSTGGTMVEKFVFTTAFKISDWNVRTSLLLTWRNITSRYPEFEALVFDENNFYSDQMLELQSTILSSLGTAILTLITVCVLFIAESSIVFWVVCTLISMDIGTAGFLSLWGADLDPTTVVNILMSIGQCIDFATHVGYRIYRSEHSDPDERIKDAMGAIGWPVVQAGCSTLLAIVVMLMVPSSAVRMFARTSVLVVATGFFHGLIILPIIIRSFATNAKAHVPTHPH